MNFSDQLIKILDDLGKKFGVLVDWGGDNVMPYAQDLCSRIAKYNLATNIFGLVVVVILFLIGEVLLLKFYSEWKRLKKDSIKIEDCVCFDENYYGGGSINGLGMAFLIVGASLTVIGLIAIPCYICDIIEGIYLPEKVIIDMIQGYIK